MYASLRIGDASGDVEVRIPEYHGFPGVCEFPNGEWVSVRRTQPGDDVMIIGRVDALDAPAPHRRAVRYPLRLVVKGDGHFLNLMHDRTAS